MTPTWCLSLGVWRGQAGDVAWDMRTPWLSRSLFVWLTLRWLLQLYLGRVLTHYERLIWIVVRIYQRLLHSFTALSSQGHGDIAKCICFINTEIRTESVAISSDDLVKYPSSEVAMVHWQQWAAFWPQGVKRGMEGLDQHISMAFWGSQCSGAALAMFSSFRVLLIHIAPDNADPPKQQFPVPAPSAAWALVANKDSWTSKTRSSEQTETTGITLDTGGPGSSQKQLGDSWRASGHNNLHIMKSIISFCSHRLMSLGTYKLHIFHCLFIEKKRSMYLH